ncbi:hypothetical protein SAMN05216387_1046 [Nitrosovibrio tenuis]|uniref:Uncharacterized protein n=1 Tax=Nitrosovibrio tenuis TaxID=1233 RepID=A0A1H7LBB8_9PROT|nr:hypothetical protein SAMN05216387_1046 [Nitrosovibrio tenuis]
MEDRALLHDAICGIANALRFRRAWQTGKQYRKLVMEFVLLDKNGTARRREYREFVRALK